MGADDRHLSVQLEQDSAKIRAVAFGKGEWAEALSCTETLFDIAFRPVINEFRGRRSVEMHLIDYRLSEAAVSAS
jgi:single-stranded-DNA-specific exonuclease